MPEVTLEDDEPLVTFEDLSGIDIDPYPGLEKLRQYGSVTNRSPMFDGEIPGIYQVIGFDAVAQVLRDERTFDSSLYDLTIGRLMGRTILSMAGEEHTAHRGLVAHAFRQRSLARWEDELIEPTVHELIDRFADRGKADLVRELTFRFPVLVIARILGLPATDYAQFQRWSLALIGAAASGSGAEASVALRDYFSRIVEERRAEPRDDLISELVTAEIDGERLDDEAIFSFLRLLLPAGVETTFRSSSNLLLLLLTHPEQLDRVRDDRSLVPAATEEALRVEPPLMLIARTPVRNTVLDGMEVTQGSTVAVWLGAANRDPSRWERPAEFDIDRPALPNASFGGGPHLCLGMHLARLEMRVALNAVLDRLPGLRLDPDTEVPRIRGNLFRSPPSVPVVFDGAAH